MRSILFLCLFVSSANAIEIPVGVDAIYGIDDRDFIALDSAPVIKSIAQSIALIVDESALESHLFKSKILTSSLKESVNMCADERFSDSPSIAGCTGFLVAKDVMATAGHCFRTTDDCKNKKIVFDVLAANKTENGGSIWNTNIFSCKEIISQKMTAEVDFALIKLDRAVHKKRLPLKLNRKNKILDNTLVFMIGHPFGLPLMHSKDAPVDNNARDSIFQVGLDSFEGSSGSPVINSETLEVEGILINGREDLVLDSSNQCYRNKNYEGIGGEGVMRISELPQF